MAVGTARRRPRSWRRFDARLASVAVLAAITAHLGSPAVLTAAAAAPADPVDSAQDVTLEALGLPGQQLFGPSNAVAVFFPPPAAPLAPAGSLLRLFFSHSPLLDPTASSARVRVNGEELAALALDPSSADGAVAEVRVPTAALRADRPNLVELRFDLRLAGRPPLRADDPSASVRLENRTMLRYQLYGPPGTPPPARLDAYPFPLAGLHGIGPARLGLVLPQQPTAADLGSAMGLVADLARRTPGQQVAPRVVSADQVGWLQAAGGPALAVGPQPRLPAADPLLRAAGFSPVAGRWAAPDGRPIGPDDGVLAALTSPWDHRSPIVLVTGGDDQAVARAAAALTAPAAMPRDAPYAVVRPGRPPEAAPTSPPPGGTVTFPAFGDRGVQVQGGGRRSVSLVFAAPAVDPGGAGDLAIAVSHSPTPAGQREWLSALVNGGAAGTLPLDRGNERETTAHLRVPGSLLRPGRNTLTLELALGGDQSAWARVGAASRLRLPGAAPRGAGLALLPHPLLDDAAGVRLVLADASDPVLTAAAGVVAALASRSTAPPRLSADLAAAAARRSLDGASLLVVGVSGSSPDAERMARSLGLPAAPVAIARGAAQPLATLEEVALSGAAGHDLLWVDGSSPAALSLAGDVLYRGGLAGTAVSVDADGRVRLLAAPAAVGDPSPVLAARVVIALAACLLIAAVAWQAWRPLRDER